MGQPQQAPGAARLRLAALIALSTAGRCDGGMFSSVCKSMGVTIPLVCSKNDSAACTSASCCKQSSCYAGGFMPMTKCDSDRGDTSCSSMMGRGYCVCGGGQSCGSNGKCGSSGSRLLDDGVRLFEELDGHDGGRVPPEDHTAGLMTYGLLAAATAGIGVRWALGGQLPRARTRSAGLLESSPGEGPELQGRGSPEE